MLERLTDLLEVALAASVGVFVFDVVRVGEAVVAEQNQIFATKM